MSVGAVNGFAGLWLQSRGMSADEIGIIFAVPVLAVVLTGIPVGRLADRASDWRQVIVLGALLSAAVPFALLAVQSFAAMLVVWTMAVVTQVVIIPVADAAAVRRARRMGGDLGRLYAFKTIGYLAAVLATGVLIETYGVAAFLPAYLAFSVVRGICALPLPAFRDAPSRRHRLRWVRTSDPTLLLPLIGWSLVHCTHSILNGFLGVLWVDQGITAATVGMLIAFSGIIEVGAFAGSKRLLDRFAPTTWIFVSCVAGVIRWGGLALAPPVEVLFALQVLHGLTYAVGFLACTRLIAELTAEEVAAEVQSAFGVLQSGVAALALVGFGTLAGMFGVRAFAACAMLAGLGALVVFSARARAPAGGA
jgi:PPP family 3-phenylpropionic acid transporter